MVAVPGVRPPVIVPVTELVVTAVAMSVLLLVHAPPVVVQLSVVTLLPQSVNDPEIEDGIAFTVTILVLRHPLGKV